ncbi:MAG: hypothetical protein M3077_05435 [Candidatus Dormibacteraeota bacterium]|nr:hypothetical protein [Candidatus Dormibacteraeota bacterium]
MKPRTVHALAAVVIAAGLLTASAADGHSLDAPALSVSLVTNSGYAGHAFVYAQVRDAASAYPAPTGRGHLSPYYANWVRQPFGGTSCPWLWTVYVFDRATNRQINAPPPGSPAFNFGTTTSVCASPGVTPVEEPPVPEAAARLDLDLLTSLSPSRPLAGTPTVLTAALSGSLTQDLNLYLNMAIEDWSVRHWSVDFGDGSRALIAGKAGNQLDLSHTYASAGTYDARVLALITGTAQAARYDRYGTVQVLEEPFSVEIANDTSATARIAPVKTYVPPIAVVSVTPSLDGRTAGANAFRQVDTLRGALTQFSVHALVTQEAWIRVGTAAAGTAHSHLVRWQYLGAASDAPATVGTHTGQVGEPTTPLQLQWNLPDRLSRGGLQEYVVPIRLFIETRFSDGHVGIYGIDSSFSVSVDFAAQSG